MKKYYLLLLTLLFTLLPVSHVSAYNLSDTIMLNSISDSLFYSWADSLKVPVPAPVLLPQVQPFVPSYQNYVYNPVPIHQLRDPQPVQPIYYPTYPTYNSNSSPSYTVPAPVPAPTYTQFPDGNTICKRDFGTISIWNGTIENGKYICDCPSGDEWNATKTGCVKKTTPLCSDQLVEWNGQCISHDADCIAKYGSNIYGTKRDDGKTGSSCYCNAGYVMNASHTTCVKVSVQKVPSRNCNFIITNLQVYKGEYQDGTSYTTFEGDITNNSAFTERVKAMIAKVYGGSPFEPVNLGEGYTKTDADMLPGTDRHFYVHTFADSQNKWTTNDIYPWFTTCK